MPVHIMASGYALGKDDLVANRVLKECSPDIVAAIDFDEVIMRLHAKDILTLKDLDHLEPRGLETLSNADLKLKKRQLYRLALANKGSAAYEGFLEVLDEIAANESSTDSENASHPHAKLAEKLRERSVSVSEKISAEQLTHFNSGERGQLQGTRMVETNRDSTDDFDHRADSGDIELVAWTSGSKSEVGRKVFTWCYTIN